MESPVIIALDGLSKETALRIAKETRDLVWGYKIHDLVLRAGLDIIAELKQYGNVFVDMKFHDIPATVEKEVAALSALGADLITVHASGGHEMLEAAVRAGGEKIVAVTALTSLSENATLAIYGDTPQDTVRKFAKSANDAGVRNIVCSPQEITMVKDSAPDAHIITPGIRSIEDPKDDQNRTMSAKEAIAAGAALLVIGRPITKAPHPRAALEKILESIS